MFNNIDAVWINASPSLKHLDLPLQQYLSKYFQIASWEYIQDNFDESSCIETGPVVEMKDAIDGWVQYMGG